MKAKIKASGEIIDAVMCLDEPELFLYKGTYYQESDLEFLPDTHEEVTIEGWVAVDEWGMGGYFLHTQEPHAESREFCDTGEYEVEWKSDGDKYELDSRLFSDMTPESEPKRVKITITPME